MENERFSVPEVLFQPSDIGFEQAGVAEAVAQSILSLYPIEQELCSANIILTGGNVRFSGFKERFDRELRSLLPQHLPMRVNLTIFHFCFVLIRYRLTFPRTHSFTVGPGQLDAYGA